MNSLPSVGLPKFNPQRRGTAATLVAVFVVVAFIGGWYLGQRGVSLPLRSGNLTNTNQPLPAYLSRDVDFSLFWRLWEHLHQRYLEQPLSDTKLFYGALEGMVAGLGDPYSVFLNPEAAQSFNEELKGTFEGVGMEIGVKAGRLSVIAPLPGTPGEKAGLKAGDWIVAINDEDTTGMPVDTAVSKIRGPRGSQVKLLIWSNGESEPREVTITRQRIEVPIVRSEIKETPSGTSLGYLKLAHFSEDASELLQAAWVTLSAQGAKGVILDLRNNPGGYLNQAIDVASHWVKTGVIVKEQFTAPEFREYTSTGQGELAGIPTVVLVNGGSASASEIVAGALQDLQLATVIGERTFGKGSVQELDELPDGSAVKLTIAKWFTPKGRSIDNNGITPDIEIELTREDADQDKDPQLDRALELLDRP